VSDARHPKFQTSGGTPLRARVVRCLRRIFVVNFFIFVSIRRAVCPGDIFGVFCNVFGAGLRQENAPTKKISKKKVKIEKTIGKIFTENIPNQKKKILRKFLRTTLAVTRPGVSFYTALLFVPRPYAYLTHSRMHTHKHTHK